MSFLTRDIFESGTPIFVLCAEGSRSSTLAVSRAAGERSSVENGTTILFGLPVAVQRTACRLDWPIRLG
jgi:hypothetical protein